MSREPFPESLSRRLDERLAQVDAELGSARAPTGRQPVHTAYVAADRYAADTAARWGAEALAALEQHGSPDALGVTAEVVERVRAKLSSEPVEDLRVDFEDGYGVRPDGEEDAEAARVGVLLRTPTTAGVGLRVKSFEPSTRGRALRTLGALLDACGAVPDGLVVCLPKVSAPEQVAAMAEVCGEADRCYGGGTLRYEIQVETPYAVARLAEIVAAAGPQCVGLHYGTYDYSAALGVAPAHQSLAHPVADHAKAVMQVAAASTGLRVVDGSSNVLPVGDGDAVRAAWALHARLVRRSLEQGIYQGWDLHPGQLVSRYAAVYAFYRDGQDVASERLRAYLDGGGGGVLDEPATARAMAGFLVRGLDCGAVDADEVSGRSGRSRADLEALAGYRGSDSG